MLLYVCPVLLQPVRVQGMLAVTKESSCFPPDTVTPAEVIITVFTCMHVAVVKSAAVQNTTHG